MNKRLAAAGLVVAYLAAIILANWSSAHWGPQASIYNAFLFIGLTLTTRDRLHDLWGSRRFAYMALLIAGGSALSFAGAHLFPGELPSDVVAKIALASCVAFAVAESMDAVGYQLLHRSPWLERSNTSNLIGAAMDSVIFVSIAFGWNTAIIFGQFCAKVAGGFIFSMILRYTGQIREIDPTTDEGALALVQAGALRPDQAPMAVLRDAQRRQK